VERETTVPAFSPDEMDQLKRAAQMFEMILDSGAQTDEAYETLKEVYAKLRMDDEFKRVTARFAEYLLARDDLDRGLAQLAVLAERYPHEPQWRERLAELGPADASGLTTDGAPGAGVTPPPVPPLSEPVSREAVEAFNRLKAIVEFEALETLRQSGEHDLQRAVREAEQILSSLDAPRLREAAERDAAARTSESGERQGAPEPSERRAESAGQAALGPVIQQAPGGVSPEAIARASAERVEAKAHAEVADDPEREFQKSLRLGEMMVERGVITREKLDAALQAQRESGKHIGQTLVELGYATEEDVLTCLALQAGVPYLPLEFYEVQREVAALLPAAFAKKYRVVPVDVIANSVLVTIASPLSPQAKEELERLLDGRKVNYYISAQAEIEAKIEDLYS